MTDLDGARRTPLIIMGSNGFTSSYRKKLLVFPSFWWKLCRYGLGLRLFHFFAAQQSLRFCGTIGVCESDVPAVHRVRGWCRHNGQFSLIAEGAYRICISRCNCGMILPAYFTSLGNPHLDAVEKTVQAMQLDRDQDVRFFSTAEPKRHLRSTPLEQAVDWSDSPTCVYGGVSYFYLSNRSANPTLYILFFNFLTAA